MAVMTEVGYHLHPSPFSTRHSILLLHTQSPTFHFRCRPTSISSNRFIFPFSPWQLHIRRSRRWDSKAKPYNTRNFNFDRDGEIEDSDDSAEQWVDAFEDYIDSIWIFKVFGSFGWMLPPILISMLLANGLKAFLLALAVPLGQSTFAFAIQRFQNRDNIKPKRKNKTKKGRSRSYSSRDIGLEEAPEFDRSHGATKKKKDQSWVSNNDVTVMSNARNATDFRGWDELDLGVVSNMRTSRRGEKKSSRQKGKTGRLGDSDGPLLLRLLISIFPFF